MTFWMFLSKERNSVRADRFLLWDNVVSMYHQGYCGHAGQWEQVPLTYHEHLQTLSRRKLLCESVGYSIPCSSSHGLVAVCVHLFVPFLPLFIFTFIYLLLLEVVYIFETMLTLYLLMKPYLNKLHMLIIE